MKTIKIILGVAFAFVSLFGMAQDHLITQKVKRIEGTLYLIENEERFHVDPKVITVKLKPSESDLGRDIKVIRSNRLGYHDIQVPNSVDVEEYVNYLKKTGRFETVEYNGEVKCCFAPNDTYVVNQWYINRTNLNAAWDFTTGNPNVKVAIIDTGVDASHYDLGYTANDGYAQIDTINGVNYTDVPNTHISPVHNHGTFVAGILGAKTNNTTGIAGVCGGNHSKGITIIPYCVGNSAQFSTSSIDDAILDAVDKGAKVINISLSTPSSTYINAAIEDAYANNVTIVCSSGNNYPFAISYPASHEKTIAVGASNQENERANFSHYGEGLDLVAPGKDIYSTTLNNGYDAKNGTSFSAPIVSGVVALMLSINPNLTPNNIRSILHSTAQKINTSTYSYNSSGWNEYVGYGLLNACAAIMAVNGVSISGPTIPCGETRYYIDNLPSSYNVEWAFQDSLSSLSNIISYNSANSHECYIDNTLHRYINEVLVAHIYSSGQYLGTIEKPIRTGVNFEADMASNYDNPPFLGGMPANQCWLIRDGTTCNIDDTGTMTITSSNFSNALVPQPSSPLIYNWNKSGNQITFGVYLPLHGTSTVCISGQNGCESFKFYLNLISNNIIEPLTDINVEYYSSCKELIVSLVETKGQEDSSIYEINETEKKMRLAVMNVNTGQTFYDKDVCDNSINISTTNWVSGIYAVIFRVNDSIITKKITIK